VIQVKADPFQIGEVLKDPKRFIVPIYQRTYSWTKEKQLESFFTSIEDKARERLAGMQTSYPHYMGAVLLSPRGKYTFGSIPVLDVVDGQQRLTTYQLLLAALKDLALENKQEDLASQLAIYLLNAPTPRMKDVKTERYKLQATAYDRPLTRDLIDLSQAAVRAKYPSAFYKNGKLKDDAPRPLRAWWYFREASKAFIEEGDPSGTAGRLGALAAAVLEDFRVIVITLDDTDDAQVIFETLNSGGEPLAAMDLVRNDVFHRAIRQDEDPDHLMEEHWKVFETPFWKQEAVQGRVRKPRIDFFLAHTLAATTGKEVLLTELYARYKAYVAEQRFATVDEELHALIRYAPTYRTLVQPEGSGPLIATARQLSVFDVSTAYPLIFVIAEGAADDEIAARLYSLVSSYVVRRALSGLTPKTYNSTFLRVAAHLRSHGVTESAFASAFAGSEGDTVRFPTDDEVRSAILTRPQYGTMPVGRLSYVIGQLELYTRDKFDETTGLREDLTIEHVLPDKWAEHWPLEDGSRAPKDYLVSADDPRHKAIAYRQVLKNTLGNLTLLTLPGNVKLSNLPFTTLDPSIGVSKREFLRTSLLKLNHEIAAQSEWGEPQILERAEVLATRAIAMWPFPSAG